MGSKTEMPTISESKTQKKTDPESDSPSSDPKFHALPSSSSSNKCELGFSSFSKLLEGVMAANSTVSPHPLPKNLGFQGPYRMSHQEALASVTAKAAQAHAQMHIQVESAKSSTERPPITPSESSVPTSSTVIHEQTPSLQNKHCIQESSAENSSCNTSDPADSSTQKFPNMKSKPVTPAPVASMLSPKKKVDKLDVKQKQPSNCSNELANDIPKTPTSDGYSWRKYGQKQVKSSGSSRSYYRCTHFLCLAKKKVQHLDISGRVIEVVYRGDHNHDPPLNPKGSSQKRDAPTAAISMLNDTSDTSVQKLDDQQTPPYGKEVQQAVVPSTEDNQEKRPNTSVSTSERDAGELHTTSHDPTPRLKNEAAIVPAEAERCRDSSTDEPAMTDPMKERDLAPLKKRRKKETGEAHPDTVYRTSKEPKVVVHAAGDAGTSCDGYRWRKYGQKMVKGSPHPRSYYRCSSAGCPVRKHVERATDDSASIIVTYEGKHNHDMPVPKKCHGSPISPVPVAALVTPNKPLPKKSENESMSCSQEPPAQQSKDANSDLNGEKGTEVGSDKVLESARTLLSIGIELKSC